MRSGAADLSRTDLLDELRGVVGPRRVLTSGRATLRYRHGYRFGVGAALAVVCPGNLLEQWRVFLACVRADVIVIVQASNTGLTGGSTPHGDGYDRDVVIISTRRITGVHLIDEGLQAVCLSGSTLDQLERRLAPLGREPHSVIGSSCIGASVIGGVCNNSGGSLIQRGPAFTQFALYARVNADGQVELVNHLGVGLGETPEAILTRLQSGDFSPNDVDHPTGKAASDHDYVKRIRDVSANTPARYNADPDRLFEASGSAGKVMVFAVRLDTFKRPERTAVFYIGVNDPAVLTRLRRDVLSDFAALPVAAEYMHAHCYDLARDYGKDTFLAIRMVGAARISTLFDVKARLDGLLPRFLTDWLLQCLSRLAPDHLPRRMRAFRERYEHYLILSMADGGVEEARRYFAGLDEGEAGVFECTAAEAASALLHRFVAAGAAIRYRAIHHQEVADLVSLDIALPRNAEVWTETLPEELTRTMVGRIYYGHFFCHVMHHDYLIARPHDPHAVEQRLLELLDRRGARYPAEHNVGHLYAAPAAQLDHFRMLDPCNCMNPGLGGASRLRFWG